MQRIFAVQIQDNIEKRQLYSLLSYVSQEKREKMLKFSSIIDMQRSLIAEVLIRIIINKELGLLNDQIIFKINEYNKPFLKRSDNFHFNISHSGKWIVCGIGCFPLGIDIEEIKNIEIKEIAKNFFSNLEYEDLMKRSKDEQMSYFYQLWTLKESFVKQKGKGLSISFNSFSLEIKDKGILFKSEEHENDIYFKQYKDIENYELALCSESKVFPKSVIIKTVKEVLLESINLKEI